MSLLRFYARENPHGDDWWVMDRRAAPPLSISEWPTEYDAREEAIRLNEANA